MSDIHVDDFYKDTGKILVQLYRTFPKPTLLFVEDICGPDTPDDYGLHSDRHQSCFSTIMWLTNAEYLTYHEPVRQEAFDQSVLSHKAFTLLAARATFIPVTDSNEGMPPSIIESQSTNIHSLRSALKSGASDKIRQIVQHLLVQSRNYR
jgi:hypothetical protein